MRKTAAAIPASKAVPGRIYAINHNNRLVRFIVSATVTRRVAADGSPHDYESKIEGHIYGPDRDADYSGLMVIEPNRLLGPYEEQVELTARRDKEKAEQARLKKENEDRRDALIRLLYDKCDLPIPDKLDDYHSPFQSKYDGLEINKAGIELLLALLRGASRDESPTGAGEDMPLPTGWKPLENGEKSQKNSGLK